MTTKTTRHIAAIVALGAALWGCGEVSREPFYLPPLRCDGEMAAVSGDWELRATGSRSMCADPDLDADLFTVGALRWTIDQSAAEEDGEPDTLSLTGGVGFGASEFSFEDAEVEGQCVRWRTTDGGVTYDWRGSLEDRRTIAGTFRTFGPETCQGEGTFRVRLLR